MVKSKGIPESPSQNAQRIQVSGILCKFCPSIFEDLKFWSFKKNKKTHPFFKAARTTDNETSFLQQCTCLKASTGSVSKCCVSHVYCPKVSVPIFFSILFISVFDGREVCFWHYFKTWQQKKHKKQLTLLLQGGEWPRNIQHPQKNSSQNVVFSPGASDSPGRRFTDGGPQSHGPPHGLAPQGAVPTSHVAVAKRKTLTGTWNGGTHLCK